MKPCLAPGCDQRAKTMHCRYQGGRQRPTFCSVRCAGQFGLLAAGGGTGGRNNHYCRVHGWQTTFEGDPFVCCDRPKT